MPALYLTGYPRPVPDHDLVDPMTTQVARVLDQARRDAGVSYRELAERTGYAKSALQNWLAGKRSPLLRDFIRIAKAVGADPGELLDRAARELDDEG